MMRWLLVWLLCVAGSACVHAVDYLSKGFAHGKVGDDSNSLETFQVQALHSVPIHVEAFELTNVPSYVNLKNQKFSLFKGKRVNNRNVYFNGQYYLFFLPNAEHGTWLLGDKLGIDSGIAYLRPSVHTLVPVDIDSERTYWHCLRDGKWTEEDRLRVVPLQDSIGNRVQYHSISYFTDKTLTESVLLMAPILGSIDEPDFQFSSSLSLPFPPRNATYPIFWKTQTKMWTTITFSFFLPQATPVRLIERKTPISQQTFDENNDDKGTYTSQIVHLVGQETSDNGWRIFFRVTGQDAGGELELMLSLSRDGLGPKYIVKPLNKNIMSTYNKKQNKKVMGVEVGSYMWLWFHAEPDTVRESRYFAVTNDDFVLKCVGKVSNNHTEKYIFQYHHSHRKVAMERTILSYTTSLVIAQWNFEINSLEWSLDGSPLIVDALFLLGPDPVSWLRDYLVSHEGFLSPSLSSCFMYHGGLSMPQQLIYAAELICVLIGAKPMTMIQYTSSSDHQWKFPLVRELTESIVLGRSMFPLLADEVDMQFNTYQVQSETLIIYRTKHRNLLHLLLPNNTAQALHIVPFPAEAPEGDNKRMDKILREQIYNSYWNGYLLGYPVRFIESYLRTFHTKLSQEGIIQEIRRAQNDVSAYFGKNKNLQRQEIRIGNDIDLLQESYGLLSHFLN